MYNKKSIAIVGMSCRFPGADNPNSFWNILSKGENMITEIGNERWNLESFFDPNPSTPNKSYQRHGAFLDRIDDFDPLLFNISPAEAIEMAPSQKLMLELTWEAIEQSKLPYNKVTNEKVGVYIGNIWNDFEHVRKHLNANTTSHSAMGQSTNIIANRISYSFGFSGPSLSVDTGCSSSLVALHLACQSLWDKSTAMCVVGGVNHILDHDQYVLLSKFGGLSKKGQCSAFSAEADGFVRGEGAGLILLKRLEDAERDGDNIIAVIKGSAMNNNGYNVNLPATSVNGQLSMLEDAYRDAGVNPSEVQYVEAHGTGTKLGDPTEAGALGTFFSNERDKDKPLKIGSVKTNIGHLEGAAGIAGLIKVLLSIRHKQIPASLNFVNPNPDIPFEELKLKVNDKLSNWEVESGKRIAGVNSFGWGGTNAHTIIEEYIPKKETINNSSSNPTTDELLLIISAKNEGSLKAYAKRYKELLEKVSTAEEVADVCVATAINKPLLGHRISFTGTSKTELLTKLEDFIQEGVATPPPLNEDRKIVFVFPGQGSQWIGMGKELYQKEAVFKQEIDECESAFNNFVNWSLTEQIFAEAEKSRLKEIDVIQPFLFAMEVAIAKLWMHNGITPDAVVGHSMGEVASAYISGSLNLKDAANIICSRSKLMKKVSGTGGAMAVTELSVKQAEEVVAKYEGSLSVAVSNSPKSTVIAGDETNLLEVLEKLDAEGLFCRQVKVDVASHSPQMEPLMEPLKENIDGIAPRENLITFYSTVEGREMAGIELTKEYWAKNLRGMVRYSDIVGELLNLNHSIFIEMSPHPLLTNANNECAEANHIQIATIASIFRDKPERLSFLSNTGKLFEHGLSVNWQSLFKVEEAPKVALPAYPMDKRNYSLEDRSALKNNRFNTINPLLGRRVNLAGIDDVFIWENKLTLEHLSFVKDHKVNDTVVLPGVSYLEILYAALKDAFGNGFHQVKSLKFNAPVFLEENESIDAQLKIVRKSQKSAQFFYYTAIGKDNELEWVECAYGDLEICGSREKVSDSYLYELRHKHDDVVVNKEEFYKVTDSIGIKYGNLFQGINWILINKEQAIAHIVPNSLIDQSGDNYFIHPAILDSCFQTIFTPVREFGDKESLYTTFLSDLKGFRWFKKPEKGDSILVRAQNKGMEKDANGVIKQKVSLDIYDESGNHLADVETLEATIIDNRAQEEEDNTMREWLMNVSWDKIDISTQQEINQKKRWVVFEDHLGVVEKLEQLIHKDNGTVIRVGPGDDFLRLDDYHYLVNYQEPESMKKLLKALVSNDLPIDGIVHAASLNDHIQYDNLHSDALEQLQYDGSILLMSLHKALMSIKDECTLPKLFVITNGLHAFSNKHMTVNLAQAPLWGMTKVLFNEQVEYPCYRLDLSFFPEESEVKTLYQLLHQEELEPGLLVRNQQVYGERLIKDSRVLTNIAQETFDEDKTFVVTGFKGIAFELVKWLIGKGVKHIALLSRSGAVTDSIASQINDYNNNGCNLKIYSVDVSEFDQLNNVFKLVEHEMPVIGGIIHAAGIIKPNTILDLEKEEYLNIVAPKIKGTWNLHQLSLTRPVDHFILFSSASTFIGLSGQGSYVAANSFLDGFARFRKKMNLPATTINWGVVKDVGMVADKQELERYALAEGFIPFEMNKGVKVLDRIYSPKLIKSGITLIDFKKTADFYSKLASTNYLSKVVVTEENSQEDGNLINLSEVTDEEAIILLESVIKSRVTYITKTPSDMVSSTSTFKGLGMDSLMAVQLRRQLEDRLNVRLMVNSFSKYPSLRSFAEFTLKLIGEKETPKSTWWNVLPKDKPKIILYCFHDAGGNSSMFLNWNDLDAEIELRAIELPGRGLRVDDKPITDFSELVGKVTLEIAQNSNGLPFVFFGHSMGGAVAYETILSLKKKGLPLPLMLFTSSTPALFNYDKKALDPNMSEEELIARFPQLGPDKLNDKKIRQELIDIMRSDLSLLSSYQYQENDKLHMPIVSLRGKDDASVSLDQIIKWKEETTAYHETIQREGGHRYIQQDEHFLVGLINEKIQSLIGHIKI